MSAVPAVAPCGIVASKFRSACTLIKRIGRHRLRPSTALPVATSGLPYPVAAYGRGLEPKAGDDEDKEKGDEARVDAGTVLGAAMRVLKARALAI